MDRSCGLFSKHDANGKRRFDDDKEDLSDPARSDDALDLWLKARDDGFPNSNDNPRSEPRSADCINSSKNNAHGDQCKDGSSGRGIVPRPPPAKGWSTSGVPSERSGAGSEVGAAVASDGVAPGTSGAGDEVGAVPEANILSVPVDAWTCHQCTW
uniref:Uncharacterized protein n=1 Tax=Aegilops tauschii TaxID=37682 RepID=R7WFI1_AEGTA